VDKKSVPSDISESRSFRLKKLSLPTSLKIGFSAS